MSIDESVLKKKKSVLRAYEQALDALENKLGEEKARIEKTGAGKKKTKKPASAGLVILVVILLIFLIPIIMPWPKRLGGSGTFYVKVATANIRKCPAANCATVDTFPLNSEINVPYGTLKAAPEWIEINFTNDKKEDITGYISKTTLSEKQTSI